MIINNLYDVNQKISEAQLRLHDKIDGVIRRAVYSNGEKIDVEIKLSKPVWGVLDLNTYLSKSNLVKGSHIFCSRMWIKINPKL